MALCNPKIDAHESNPAPAAPRVRVFGNIDDAEEAVPEAFVAALERRPSAILPPSPEVRTITTACNRAIDKDRRDAAREDRHGELLCAPPAS